jgi:adenylosuccinate lyase
VIDRYSYPEMKAIWELRNRFAKWLEVETLVCEGLAELGQVPPDAAAKIRANATFDVDRILELEGDTPGTEQQAGPRIRHDLIAFLKSVMESLGPESKYLHLGVTSHDIEDTALAALLQESADLIDRDLEALETAIRVRAHEHRRTLMIGRSHGVHAEPITFGFKLAVWLAELQRGRERLRQARQVVSVGKISGAVGTYANIDPRVEQYVCRQLKLEPSPASTQVLQRDRHAQYIAALAILAGSLERFATEVRSLQRTDILEVEEPGQRGSSSMPHKRNPIVSERVTGLARLMRSYVAPAIENMALWHERDISHSSVERVILPDANILMDYMLRKFTVVVEGMVVYPERMRKNLDRTRGLVCSEQVMLALVRKGMEKDDAYKLVQGEAMKAWDEDADFRALVAANPVIAQALTADELAACFDYERHLKHLDLVFERLGI